MLSQKVKVRPPPLRLICQEDQSQQQQQHGVGFNNHHPDLSPRHPFVDYAAEEAEELAIATATSTHSCCNSNEQHSETHYEFYQQFESTLIDLLHEDELMPFNLHTAASLGITSSVRHLIERCDVDPDCRNSGNWTAMMYASLFSHNETVLYLLEMKADVDLKNPHGKTPLMLASICGSEETIKLLLDHGASLEERDQDQFTALMLAIQATHCESAQLLIDYGADPNVREEIHGQTPLYIAAQTGQYSVAQSLVEKGVDVGVKTSSGDTAYHVALRNGYPAIAKLITDKEVQLMQQQHLALIGQQQEQTAGAVSSAIVASTAPIDAVVALSTVATRPTHLPLPAPTQFKPKSPYTAFFDRFAQFQEAAAAIPEVVVHDVDAAVVPDAAHCWFPSPGDVTRYSPEGVECGRDGSGFNLFNAWPGTSVIYKQAITANPTTPIPMQQQQQQTVVFKKSISKPPHSNFGYKTPVTPSSMPWSPSHERYPAIGSQDCGPSFYDGTAAAATSQVKLPKDLSSVLANLGLAKYQTYFEEQDIDLQVFLTMNEADLREIGISSLGARRKCLSTIEYYQTKTNHYRISDEFMVNTWVSKKDLSDLKLLWGEMTKNVAELRSNQQALNVLPWIERLVKQMQRAEDFFKKY